MIRVENWADMRRWHRWKSVGSLRRVGLVTGPADERIHSRDPGFRPHARRRVPTTPLRRHVLEPTPGAVEDHMLTFQYIPSPSNAAGQRQPTDISTEVGLKGVLMKVHS